MSEPMEPLKRSFDMVHPQTGEEFEVQVTVTGHIDPMAAAAAIMAFASEMDRAVKMSEMAAAMLHMGVPQEQIEQMLGLDMPCMNEGHGHAVDNSADADKILASVTDEGFDQFLRELS